MTAIGADNGFFSALIYPDNEAIKDAVRTSLGIPEDIAWLDQTWREMQVHTIETPASETSVASSLMLIPNPNPILMYGGEGQYLVLMADSGHFEGIVNSIEFGLEHVPPADIAASILDIVETHAWVRRDVDWQSLLSRAQEITSLPEVSDFLSYYVLPALREAGDNHSFVRVLDGLVNAATPTTNGLNPNLPTGEIVEGFGYLKFPGHNSFAPEYAIAYATTAAQIRDDLADQGASGWIIDLREMGGGGVSPVLTALYPFLPDGRLAGFVDSWDNELWIEKDGQTISPGAYNIAGDTIPWREGLNDSAIRVAVLTGGGNGSAGEFVQLALMSRDNLQTFGGQTAGYTIGNQSFPLFNNSVFALATSAELDADGNVYTSTIKPDVVDSLGLQTGISENAFAPVFDWLNNG